MSVGGRIRSRDVSSAIGLFAIALIIIVPLAIAVVIVMVPLTVVGHLLGLTPSLADIHRSSAWVHAHYPLLGFRFVLTAVLFLATALLLMAAFTKTRAPAGGETSNGVDQRRWIAVIRSVCAECGHINERAGGVLMCPRCGMRIPDDAHTTTDKQVLER